MNSDHGINPHISFPVASARERSTPTLAHSIPHKFSDRLILLGFGISLGLLSTVGILFYFSVQELKANQRLAEKTQSTLAIIQKIASNIKEAELGRRGYLLTGKAEFLRNFKQTIATSEANFSVLSSLMQNRPLQRERLQFLETSFTARLALFKTLLDRPINRSEQIQLTSQSWRLRQKIEYQLNVMRESEQNSLFRRSRATQSIVHRTLFLGFLGALLSVLFLSSVYLLLTCEVRRKRAAEKKLASTNQQLKDHLQEQSQTLKDLVSTLRTEMAERSQAEQKLRENEMKSQLMFEQHPQPMWIYDLETLKFLAVNQSAIQLYGYSRRDFLTRTLPDMYAPSYRRTLLQSIVSLISEGLDQSFQETYGIQERLLNVITISRLISYNHHSACLVLINFISEPSPAATNSCILPA